MACATVWEAVRNNTVKSPCQECRACVWVCCNDCCCSWLSNGWLSNSDFILYWLPKPSQLFLTLSPKPLPASPSIFFSLVSFTWTLKGCACVWLSFPLCSEAVADLSTSQCSYSFWTMTRIFLLNVTMLQDIVCMLYRLFSVINATTGFISKTFTKDFLVTNFWLNYCSILQNS